MPYTLYMCTLAAVALLLPHVLSVKPGVKIRLSQNGLNYAASIAVDILSNTVQQSSFPDQSGMADAVIGAVSYEFTNMKVERCSFYN